MFRKRFAFKDCSSNSDETLEQNQNISKNFEEKVSQTESEYPNKEFEFENLMTENEMLKVAEEIEMMEKTKTSINFKFNLIISDLKNFTKLLSELKQRQYRFKIIRHTNKKYAFFKKLFKGLKKN